MPCSLQCAIRKRRTERAAALRKQGIKVVALDISDDASVIQAVNEVLALKRIDVLINNAGIYRPG